MSEPKRRRIEPTAESSSGVGGTRKAAPTAALSSERLSQEVDALLRGRHGERSIAWSPHSLIAFASPAPRPVTPTDGLVAPAPTQKAKLATDADAAVAPDRDGRPSGSAGSTQAGGAKDESGKNAGSPEVDGSGGRHTEDAAKTTAAAVAAEAAAAAAAAQEQASEQIQAQAQAFHALLPPPAQSVTLRYMPMQHSSKTGTSSAPKPPALTHKLFPSLSLLPVTSAVSSAKLISFSPSGRTLIAYFPAAPLARCVAAATRAGELAAAAHIHAQMHAQAQAQAHAQAQAQSQTAGSGAGAGGTGSAGAPLRDARAGASGSAQTGSGSGAQAVSAGAGAGAGTGTGTPGNSRTAAATGPGPASGTPSGQPSAAGPHPHPPPPPPDPSQVPTSLAPSAGKGRLCIWTQGASRALNDWVLRQVIFVDDEDADEGSGASKSENDGSASSPRPAAAPGFVHLDGIKEPVAVPIPAAPLSGPDAVLEGVGMPTAPVMVGDICEVRWCDDGSKLFFHPNVAVQPAKPGEGGAETGPINGPQPLTDPLDSYIRDAMRGPTLARVDPNAGPSSKNQGSPGIPVLDDPEEACFLFSSRGTFTVLHRHISRQPRGAQSFPNPPAFAITTTTLFEADILALGARSSRTLEAEQAFGPKGGGRRKIGRQRISHLAVGGAAEDPLGLLSTATGFSGASGLSLGLGGAGDGGLGLGIGLDLQLNFKGGGNGTDDRSEVAHAALEGMIGLTELQLKQHGNLTALVVRPLEPVPMPRSQRFGTDEATCSSLTHLQWLEHPSQTPSAPEGPAPLPLLLVCSHDASAPSTASMTSVSMDVDLQHRTDPSSSVHKYLFRRQVDSLTEAFGSLECKKADLPPGRADWGFYEAGAVLLTGQTILSILPPQDMLLDNCLVTIAARHERLEGEQDADGSPRRDLWLHKWAWLDSRSLELSEVMHAGLVPFNSSYNHVRSVWSPSPNRTFVARMVGERSEGRIQILSMPAIPKFSSLDPSTRLGILLGRGLRAGSSCEDMASLLLDFSDDASLQSALNDALDRAGTAQGGGNTPMQSRNRLGQIQKLAELYMLTRGRNLDVQRFFLELLCSTRLLALNDLGRLTPYLPFRFDAIWALLAQLSWMLQCLNKLSRTAVYLEAEKYAAGLMTRPREHPPPPEANGSHGNEGGASSNHTGSQTKFAARNTVLELLVLPAPLALFTHVANGLYKLAFWLVGDEVGPPPSTLIDARDAATGKASAKYKAFGVRNVAFTAAVCHSVIAWRKRQVGEGDLIPSLEAFQGPGAHTTIAQQFEHAADACRAILDASAVNLHSAVVALENMRAMLGTGTGNGAEDAKGSWWTHMASAMLSDKPEYQEQAAGWLSDDHGCEVDLVSLFVSPEDLLDDVHALDRINVSAAATAQMRPELRPSGPKQQDPHSRHARSAEQDLLYVRDEVDMDLLTVDVIRKTALQLPPVNYDQSAAATAALLGGFGASHQHAPPPPVPTVVKSCVRCGARTGAFELPPVLAKGVAPVEEAFRRRCLCGGNWWLLST
ncbi:hypothetical protein OC842_003457 [Tilletia horrida]|uniref:Uncharacterized protein n=1 Tax=Tilletia horrida TaxID=155126 RepID=A0AAN6JKF2_9BASI|nr:hypothetical protein OC842_003457 [Tilletia horrida]